MAHQTFWDYCAHCGAGIFVRDWRSCQIPRHGCNGPICPPCARAAK